MLVQREFLLDEPRGCLKLLALGREDQEKRLCERLDLANVGDHVQRRHDRVVVGEQELDEIGVACHTSARTAELRARTAELRGAGNNEVSSPGYTWVLVGFLRTMVSDRDRET